MIKTLNKAILADFSRSVAKRMQVITNKTHHNTLINGMSLFFPENSTDFVYQKLPEEIQSKIVYFFSVINERHSAVEIHSTSSCWQKWSDFEYGPWCLLGTGSRLSACSLIKLPFSNLLLFYRLIIHSHVSQRSQSVFQSRIVFQSNVK